MICLTSNYVENCVGGHVWGYLIDMIRFFILYTRLCIRSLKKKEWLGESHKLIVMTQMFSVIQIDVYPKINLFNRTILINLKTSVTNKKMFFSLYVHFFSLHAIFITYDR